MASTVAGQGVSGVLNGGSQTSTAFQPIALRPFNIWVTGTWTATIGIVRSFDGGATWVAVPKPDMTGALTLTQSLTFSAFEADQSCLWALQTVAYTSGTINYQFDQ